MHMVCTLLSIDWWEERGEGACEARQPVMEIETCARAHTHRRKRHAQRNGHAIQTARRSAQCSLFFSSVRINL